MDNNKRLPFSWAVARSIDALDKTMRFSESDRKDDQDAKKILEEWMRREWTRYNNRRKKTHV